MFSKPYACLFLYFLVSFLNPTLRLLFLSLKLETISLSSSDWLESSSLAAALSSAVAELVWITRETWSIPTLICPIPVACSSEDAAISETRVAAFDTPSTISSKAFAVLFAISVPFSDFFMEPSIRSVVSFAALALLAAKLNYRSYWRFYKEIWEGDWNCK